MQFSLRTLMIGVLVVAIALVVPEPLVRLMELIVWVLIPSVLVGLLMYGDAGQKAFATGSLSSYLAMTWLRGEMHGLGMPLRWLVSAACLFLSGWLAHSLQQRWADVVDPPPPPPG